MMTGGDYEFQIVNRVKRNPPDRGQEALEQIPKLLHQALRHFSDQMVVTDMMVMVY